MESIDKENKSPKLVVIIVGQALSLRFEKKEDRDRWVDTIVTEGDFGEDVSFDGIVPSKQALTSGEVTLHIYPDFFTLVRKQNCRCLGRWHFQQLFNYGVVDGGFVFRIENENEKSAEPESFFLFTSFENQINRTFDTVYKTASNVYGSAEGLQRRPKLNSPGSEPSRRPRSMSEPSGFKRFMQRLSFRRKSRRPKKPKLKTGSLTRPLSATPQKNATNRSEAGSRQDIAKANTGKPSRSASDIGYQAYGSPVGATSASVSVDVRQNPKASCDGRTGRQTNGNVYTEGEPIRPSGSQDISSKNEEEVVRNGGAERAGCDSGNKPTKTKSMEMKDSLSSHHTHIRTDGMAGSADELNVWQRRSALLPNTDDMIQQGFIKTKQPERRRSGDSAAGGAESNNNPPSDAWAEESTEPGMRQSRSSTIGSRRRMPNLTIEITPSGSDPSLNQYVNVALPVKNKLIPKLKQGEWDRYDSEENVYHRLDAVVGPLGYENIPAGKSKSVTSLDNSYRNLPATYPNGGHSYENVSGAPDTARMHYVNVEAKKRQNVNYIRVEGSGPSTPVLTAEYSPVSRKPNVYADYAEIDAEKTKQLRELAEQREERAKNN